MKMKQSKVFIVFMSMILVLSLLAGCSNSGSESEDLFTPGTYTATAKGHEGEITVEVTVSKDEIVSVEVVDHSETAGIGDAAINIIKEKITTNQTLNVEVVTGATVTSKAILEAVELALTQAGANIDALKNKGNNNDGGQAVTLETDVVVVGGGVAGLAAALEAKNNGADVIVVEKLPFAGGSTIRSGGKILAANTSIQESLGIKDNAADFAAFLMEIGENQVDEDFINLIANNSAENIEWLMENGVEFAQDIEPLHGYRSPARGHYTADSSGAGIITPLENTLKEKGVEILYSTPALELIQDGGKVIGIYAENDNGDKITINAKAVILATGGFTRNPDLVDEYFTNLGNFSTNVGEGNTGDGITMGLAAGADVIMPNAGIDIMMNFATGYGYGEEATELFVTPDGERFMDERDFHFKRTRILYDYGFDNFWYIIDEKSYNDRVAGAVQANMAFEADTIEELAGKIGIKPEVLKTTVERYNELCVKGKDLDFNKPSQYMVPINQGKFYALAMTKSNSGTHGGLKINIDAQVINKDGNVIPGLYAAGEVASGQILHQEYPGSGTAIIAFLTFGRQAGAAAAME
ncbi:FAD-dependent oxidoreductase [Alkalicella caledoniensis]|uniref:Urocanate reductase n=1 Tax=Alkalicella caledoniensis TaxID=2731377 RepID=A0A7G9W6F7_ALKCA|nr:FAD-dependent oxidoreductase [Alkalicella caledoniensis]QNO14269.1 FAD-dependent oxidoreductase [Alkalicella caledoniensis]